MQSRVFQAARQMGMKVLLDGQGADEMLAGYHSHLGARLASMVRHGKFFDAYRFLQSCTAALALADSGCQHVPRIFSCHTRCRFRLAVGCASR